MLLLWKCIGATDNIPKILSFDNSIEIENFVGIKKSLKLLNSCIVAITQALMHVGRHNWTQRQQITTYDDILAALKAL